MSRILLGVIAVLGLFTFFLWNENSKLAELNQAFDLRDQEQKLALKTVTEDFALQTSSLNNLQTKNNAITKQVFDSIEADSRRIDSLDDGLQLQSDS